MIPSEWLNRKLFQSSSTPSLPDNQQCISTAKAIKLSVITQFFPPDYAATGQLIEELVRHLESLGIDIEVFTSQPGYAFHTPSAPAVEQWGRIRIRRSRSARLWPSRIRGKAINGIVFTLRATLHLIRARHYHNLLLLTTAPPFLPVVGYLAHVCFRIPYVCVLYDLYPDIAIALGVVDTQHWLARFWQSVNRLIWRHAKGIIVLSPAMKRQVVANYPKIADKVAVIHSWGNPDQILPLAKQENWFAWKYGLVNKFTVLYSGNMGRCHDMHTILDAAQQLQDEAIQFVFIGGGFKREYVVEEVEQLGLKNFLFLPYQDKEVLPYSLTACDLSLVSVDATTDSLVAPSKLYPALAAGRPVAVICPQYSYLRQLIADANCGGTFENGDSHGLAQFIRLLKCDRDLAQGMGKSAREYLRSHFTPQMISQQYLDVLQRAIF